MGQWSKLPGDLLDIIQGNLLLYSDKVRVRAVCESWNSQLPKLPNLQARQLPLLLLQGSNGIEEEASHALFDPFEKKFYHLNLPEAEGKFFKGSSHGWVVTIEDITSTSPADIYLIDPLTKARIQLPSRSTFDVKEYNPDRVGEEYAFSDRILLLHKVVLSSTPSRNDCIVVAIYSYFARLAFCKCNDERWTSLNIPTEYPTSFVDVAFYKQKLYALSGNGKLLRIENIGPNPMVTGIVMNEPYRSPGYHYLAESSDGDLIMVSRYSRLDYRSSVETREFRLNKVEFSHSSLVEVKNIGEDMMFLDISSSLSISSLDFPGLKGNCIYYIDRPVRHTRKHKYSDIGVFMFDEKMFDNIPGFKCDPNKLLRPPPVWLMPAQSV